MPDTVIEFRGLRIEIIRDDYAQSPATWDNEEVFLVHFHRQFQVCPNASPVKSGEALGELVRSMQRPDGEPIDTDRTPRPEEGDDAWNAVYDGVFLFRAEEQGWPADLVDAALSDVGAKEPSDGWPKGWQNAEIGARCVANVDLGRRREIWDAWEAYDEDITKEWVVFLVSAYIHSGVCLYLQERAEDYDPANHHRDWDTSLAGAVFIKRGNGWGDAGSDDAGYYITVDEKYQKLPDGGRRLVTWESVAESLIAEWNQYLSGDVYGFRIVDPDTGEELDSCWGFYGEDVAIQEAKGTARWHADRKDAAKAALAGLVAAIEALGDDGILDEAVHDIFSAQAAAVNKEGIEAQVKYLLDAGHSLDGIAKMVTP